MALNDIDTILSIAQKSLEVQSKAIFAFSHRLDQQFYKLVIKIHQANENIFFSGIGKSGLIAQKIVATLNSIGIRAFFLNTVDALHGDVGKIKTDDVVICISKSGNTPELVALTKHLQNFKVSLVAWTSNNKSQLAKLVDIHIPIPIENEVSKDNLIPTTSSTLQLCLGDALAICLLELKKFSLNHLALYHPSGQIGKQLTLTLGQMIGDNPLSSVKPTTPVKQVIVEISNKRLGATVVIDHSGIAGIITDGDIRRTVEQHDSLVGLIANDIMTSNPIKMHENTLAKEALVEVKKKKINQLIIHDDELNYIGLLHIMDFIKEGL
ncbi:MAG: KpsF/GutQ family sugar-phosphate isomerase [Flavobacteriaceae bacterium]|nr:KpsF/GutQ family sugar-phosphate isomerase [Flavobacteriaceae bacterium]